MLSLTIVTECLRKFDQLYFLMSDGFGVKGTFNVELDICY